MQILPDARVFVRAASDLLQLPSCLIIKLSMLSTWNQLIYCLLASIRLILTVVPQPGYIHPDEFFQSPEIIAGKLIDFRLTSSALIETSSRDGATLRLH